MLRQRIPETDNGIQGEITVLQYDQMQRSFRDKGWMETTSLISSGITDGHCLEIGHGPGYLGLEWLKLTQKTTLTGLDISPDMQVLAMKNAKSYNLTDRTKYELGQSDKMPFQNDSFDAVFSNGSLHEWNNPVGAFNEIHRVLKPGGKYFISDLRRDVNFFMYGFLWLGVRPTQMRPGLSTSVGAAYTANEITEILQKSLLNDAKVKTNLIGLEITGMK